MLALFALYIFLPAGSLFSLGTTFLIAIYLIYRKKEKPSDWKGLNHYTQNLFHYFKFQDRNLKTFREIFWWWELRRVPFNLLVLAAGISSSSILEVGLFFKPPQNLSSSWGYISLCVLYGLGANIFYSAGWFVEGTLKYIGVKRTNQLGALCHKIGIIFSISLTLIIPPALLIILILIPEAW